MGRGDLGGATVLAVVAVAVLGAVFAGALAAGQAVVARHRAGGAADLAALAAAARWMRGEAAACGEAAEVASAQHARLVRCSVYGEVSDVTVEAGAGPYRVAVRARAGHAGPVAAGLTPRGSPWQQEASGPPAKPGYPGHSGYPGRPGRPGLP
ncbi:Rv3654c family TadE-like protein [Streptomyces sp. NPDC002994]|uniref:Rv3654c family TadE-like protein n=1 Tax=Streptomyces sp. NPDC002994 TaxID=3154441 RepID=UPI00339DEAAE